MPDHRPPLLLTRPAQASARFAAAFRAEVGADWPVVLSPLMETVWQSPTLDLDGAAALIFSSENAVHGYCRLQTTRNLRAWCVGARTTEVARRVGFDAVEGPGDAARLADMILRAGEARRMLWPHGQQVAFDIADRLNRAGIETVSVAVYDQKMLMPTAAARALMAGNDPVLLPLFSPRSAVLAQAAFPDHRAPLWVAALSPSVAEACTSLEARRLSVAVRPDSGSLLAALKEILSGQTSG